MRTYVLFCLILLSLYGGSLLAQSKTGTSVGQFLLIEPSARIAGMGNAGVTNYEEIQAAYYNPAAIGYYNGYGAQFTHSPWLAGITFDYASVGLSFGDFGNMMLSVTSLNSGDIAVTTVQMEHGTGENYSVTDLAFSLGYGRQVSERFSVGVTATYLQETIWHSSMSAFAMSVGTIYRISSNGLHIGASLSNFGTRPKFDGNDLLIQYGQDPSIHGENNALPAQLSTDNFPLPMLFRVGIGMPVNIGEDNKIHIAIDAFHPSDNTESVSFGGEWGFHDMLFLRAGYQNLFQKDSELGLTLGAGVQYQTESYRFNFDYGWADEGRLDKVQRLTFGLSF